MNKILFLFLALIVLPFYAQVGIGTETPDPSSILDIASSNKGLLVPRVSLTNSGSSTPITTPAVGLLVYNLNTAGDVVPGFYYWTGSNWKALISTVGGGGNGWGLQGNVVGDNDFLGTLQNYKPLKFKINGNNFGQFHPDGGISIGLSSTAAADNAIAIGTSSSAGTSNSIAIGTSASTSASNFSTAIGANSQVTNHQSTALGYEAKALQHSAVALGSESNASGIGSTAIGRETSASGQYSTALGYGATVSQANTIRIGNADAQIGIGTSTPPSSAILEIKSSNKGILIPRVALAGSSDQSLIPNPAESLLIYNTNTAGTVTPGFYFWQNGTWKPLGGSGGGGGEGSKTYGEIYFTNDASATLQQNDIVVAPAGTANPLSTSNLTVGNDGFTLQNNGGTYRVTCTITYSKSATGGPDEIEFFLTLQGNKIDGTSVRGTLKDDLKRNTVTISRIMTLNSYQKYYFGMNKTAPSTGIGVKIHKDLTSFIIEKVD